jgi:hypothetical protein
MQEILPFLQKYENWIYILLGTLAFIYFQKLIVAWRDWQGTVFGLERDIAQRRFTSSLTVVVLLVLFLVMEFAIVSFVVPNYPQFSALATPTLDVVATPTVTLPAQVLAVTAINNADVTPTFEVPLQEGCTPGQIEWTYPKPGDPISATVELKGTVNVPNLGFYKYEFAQPGDKDMIWNTIAAGNQPKVDGGIGFWNTSQLVPGDYLLRLVVVDNQNKPFSACVVAVRVVQP